MQIEQLTFNHCCDTAPYNLVRCMAHKIQYMFRSTYCFSASNGFSPRISVILFKMHTTKYMLPAYSKTYCSYLLCCIQKVWWLFNRACLYFYLGFFLVDKISCSWVTFL